MSKLVKRGSRNSENSKFNQKIHSETEKEPMGTGCRPEKKFWVPIGTGYRENFHLCRPLIIQSKSRNFS